MNRPFLIGLTGSIGMGKTTTAKMFAEHGIPVWDADAAVHRLYGKGGAAVPLIAKLHSDAVVDGAVSRDKLKDWISQDKTALSLIEQIVHPLVAADRLACIKHTNSDVLLMDIPLLFEGGTDALMDATVVVTAPADEQRRRVLARGSMTEAQFDAILAKQMPDSEKRARADFVIETTSLEAAAKAVDDAVAKIREMMADA